MNEKAKNPAQEYSEILRKKLGDSLRQIILFGSHARGSSDDGSDYDVLVVVDERTPDVREAALDAGVEMMNKHESLFAPLIYSEEEWLKAQAFPIGWNIQKEGIPL